MKSAIVSVPNNWSCRRVSLAQSPEQTGGGMPSSISWVESAYSSHVLRAEVDKRFPFFVEEQMGEMAAKLPPQISWKREELVSEDSPSVLFVTSWPLDGSLIHQWTRIMEIDGTSGVVITALCPSSLLATNERLLMAAISSARLGVL